MDEREHIQKLRRLKVIITEVLMVIATILLVVALTFVVMGYSFNLCEFARGGGEVIERTGLLQIASLPTGATIGIDGGTPLLLRTNASRTVVSGEHEITLTKDGYDSWKKVVNVSEGMMYRLNYPRLFLLEREEEEILDLKGYTFISVAPSKTKILFGKEGKLYVATLVAKPVVKELAAVAQKIETFEEIGWSG
ncbi:PEGA domain-containing protein, partial [Candidatus Saccharibacteria bacterium]|nr:PEGA domain-containing protein [Candidatus Saccharibacteria bacterium]